MHKSLKIESKLPKVLEITHVEADYKRCLYFGFTSNLHSGQGNCLVKKGSYLKQANETMK